MNLSKLGVQELSSKELKNLDGGGWIDYLFNGTTHGKYGANPIGYTAEALSNGYTIGNNIFNAALVGIFG